ncbi:gibberellin-regulated protein 5-like [Aristolochia californica]|uniref:gibberellin-regulated protein 5-like n=1 Tax=Aristolochia californica TaxID=171875 RepID=UPI0035D92635
MDPHSTASGLTMARKPTVAVFFLAMLLVLTKESMGDGAYPETPAPQPATFPMHGTTEGSLRPEECTVRCAERCSATAYKKPCKFFCGKCCGKCLCVPPGTYGNKQVCPCYNNWKTKRGGPKCP